MNAREREGEWRRLHPATPFLRSAQLLYALVFATIAARLGGPGLIVLAVSAVLVAAAITASYVRFRYRLTEDGLIVQHGVLFRQRRVVPRSRIQNVDLRAGLLLQILGVVTARVETAGGQGSEATLHVVSRDEGRRLRESLVARPAASLQPPSQPGVLDGPDDSVAGQAPVEPTSVRLVVDAEPESIVQTVTVRDLIIAGATSNRASLLVAALLGGDYFLDILPTDWLLGKILPAEFMQPEAAATSLVETAQHDLRAFVIGVVVLVLFFGLAGWGLSVLASVIRFYDFTLTQRGGEFRVTYGSFTRREKGFRCSRVQNVQVEEPIIRRWFGLASIKVQTAGYGPTVKADDRIETLTPIVRRANIAFYLQLIHPELRWEDVEWRPSHPRALRRLFLRRAVLVLIVTGTLTSVMGYGGLAFLFALIPAWFLAKLHYRHLGHAWTQGHMLVREGFWTRRTYVVPIRKIQALHFRQTPFQRRLNLGTLILETAGSPIEWHSPRSIDLGRDYGLALMDRLGAAVRRTGLVF